MLINIVRLKPYLLLALLAGLASGCATPALWHRTSAFEWNPAWYTAEVLLPANTNQPSAPIVLFEQMAQFGPNTFIYRNVGWRVGQPPGTLADTRQAIRQLTNSAARFLSVRVYHSTLAKYRAPTHESSRPPGYALINDTNYQLTLHIDGLPPGPYTLPSSYHPKKTAERVVLAPFAVVLDVPVTAFGIVLFLMIMNSPG
jgi:hypothetical protein